MFAAPPLLDAEVFMRIPAQYLFKKEKTCILEGPSFDRDGNLYFVNIPDGSVFRISPDGALSVVAEYDGEPNGLRIHRDGRIFIADHKLGIVLLDPGSGKTEVLLDRPRKERFRGLNDLMFNSKGDLYFTDQGESGWQDQSGRLWVLKADGNLQLLLDNIPSPNGLVITSDDKTLFLAVTRANAVWRVPLLSDGTVGRVGTFIQMSGGNGPDGLALDEAGSLIVAHSMMGVAWVFSDRGRPIFEVRAPQGVRTTNIAFGGPERKRLYIMEGDTSSILVADLPTAGQQLYSHA